MIKNHANLLRGTVSAFSACATATAAEAAKIIHDSCLRFGDRIPDMLEADHDPDFTSLSEVLWASVRPATAWASASS